MSSTPKKYGKAFICGTARNCGKYVESVFSLAIRQIEPYFDQIHIIVAYDESTDNTLMELIKQKHHYKDRMDILMNHVENLGPIRTKNISNARNSILERMRKYFAGSGLKIPYNIVEWSYFIMLDLDDVCSGAINREVFERAMDANSKWDSISFNRPRYYDIWALSIPPYIYSCWGWANPYPVIDATRKYLVDKLSKLSPGELLPVISAFNGFAIYKTNVFLRCRYDWRIPHKYMSFQELMDNGEAVHYQSTRSPINQQTDEPDCEHRHFHMEAIHSSGARVMVSPEYLFDHDFESHR